MVKSNKKILFLIFNNLVIPLIGLFFLDWFLNDVLLIYWLESLFIILFGALKILMLPIKGSIRKKILVHLNKLILVLMVFPFFIFFLVGYASILRGFIPDFKIINNLKIQKIFFILSPLSFLLLIDYCIQFFSRILSQDNRETVNIMEIMGQVFIRILTMHFCVILGAFVKIYFNLGKDVAIIIGILIARTFLDLLLETNALKIGFTKNELTSKKLSKIFDHKIKSNFDFWTHMIILFISFCMTFGILDIFSQFIFRKTLRDFIPNKQEKTTRTKKLF